MKLVAGTELFADGVRMASSARFSFHKPMMRCVYQAVSSDCAPGAGAIRQCFAVSHDRWKFSRITRAYPQCSVSHWPWKTTTHGNGSRAHCFNTCAKNG